MGRCRVGGCGGRNSVQASPPFKKGGLYPELAELGERFNDYDTSLHKSPELAKAVGEQIRRKVIDVGIAKDLGLDLSKPDSLTDHVVHDVQDHLLKLKGQNIPYGLHTFGRVPEKPLRDTKTTWNMNAAIDEQGIPWVVFDTEVSTRASEVYVAKVDGSATAVRLTKDDGAPSKYPDLAIGAGGRMALSWQDERDGNVEVYLLTGVLGDLSGEIDGRSRRVTNTPGETIGAYLAWNGDRIGLSWSDKTSGQHEVYFESFDATGMPREAACRLTGNTTWSLVPAIRPRGDGFALAWNEYQPESVEVHDGGSEVFFLPVP